MNKTLTKLFYYCARFLQVQLFLTIASFPFLVAWGLPLSLMTAVGNFIFSPFLTLFLLCASLIFFTECFFIPNGWLIYCLEIITDSWLWCLSWGKKTWLIGFYKPSLLLLMSFVIVAFIIMQHKKLTKLIPSLFSLSFILVIFTSYLSLCVPINTTKIINCGKKQITISLSHGEVEIHDNGSFASKLSPESWIQYSFLSELTKKIGSTHIDHLIITNPGALTFKALSTLCTHITVKKITLPYFTKKLSKYGWKNYFEFKKIVEQEKIQLIREKAKQSNTGISLDK